MDRFADFDAALESIGAREPVRVRLLDKEWELYPDLPALAAIRLTRWEATPERQLADEEVLALLAELVPPKVYEAWMGGGLGVRQLAEVMKELIALYRDPGEADDEEEPAEPAPKRRRASSSAGRSSKRTSRGSTGSS